LLLRRSTLRKRGSEYAREHRPEGGISVLLRDDPRIVLAADAVPERPEYRAHVTGTVSLRMRQHAGDLVIAILAGATFVELLLSSNASLDKATSAPLCALAVLPLLVRRRWPIAALTTSLALVFLAQTLDSDGLDDVTTPFFVLMAIAVAAGGMPERRDALAGVAGTIAAVGYIAWTDPEAGYEDAFFLTLFVSAAWAAAHLISTRTQEATRLRERAERAEQERDRLATEAVADERARELHDVIAHSISVMVVQAAGVRRLLTAKQEREREALLAVERVGREALSEMRRMLGVLRERDDAAARAPAPGLQHLDRLVEQVRNAGVDVDLRVDGDPIHLPPGLDLSAYRIVQEGLANAVRHPGAGGAHVRVRYTPEELELEVIDDNGGGSEERLTAIRERVAVYGGHLEAGPGPDGGFQMRARLPLAGVR
jgi:signal transduction histidine kinase